MGNHLMIASAMIRQNDEGLYCLNDLHAASGGEQKKRPKYWLENQHTTELIAEVEKGGTSAVRIVRGRSGGTYVAKELVYAYAMWLSPKFHLAVIRTYDAMITQGQSAQSRDIDWHYQLQSLQAAIDAEKKRSLVAGW